MNHIKWSRELPTECPICGSTNLLHHERTYAVHCMNCDSDTSYNG